MGRIRSRPDEYEKKEPEDEEEEEENSSSSEEEEKDDEDSITRSQRTLHEDPQALVTDGLSGHGHT